MTMVDLLGRVAAGGVKAVPIKSDFDQKDLEQVLLAQGSLVNTTKACEAFEKASHDAYDNGDYETAGRLDPRPVMKKVVRVRLAR